MASPSVLLETEDRRMKFAVFTYHRFVFLLLLFVGFAACERYPSNLSSSGQIQAVVFEHLALDLFGGSVGDEQSLRLFLSSADPSDGIPLKDADPSVEVMDYCRSRFPSTRPFSASRQGAYEFTHVETATGMDGILLRVPLVDVSGDGPITFTAGHFSTGKNAAGYKYRVQRVNGRWKVIDRERLWVA